MVKLFPVPTATEFAKSFHCTVPVAQAAVSVTVPVPQRLPLVTVGEAGVFVTLTITTFDVPVVQFVPVQLYKARYCVVVVKAGVV